MQRWHGMVWVRVCRAAVRKGTQGKLCSLDLSSRCYSAFGMSGALNEPKAVGTWSDGDAGTAGWCLSCVDPGARDQGKGGR